jgi:hypothetical protein
VEAVISYQSRAKGKEGATGQRDQGTTGLRDNSPSRIAYSTGQGLRDHATEVSGLWSAVYHQWLMVHVVAGRLRSLRSFVAIHCRLTTEHTKHMKTE